MKITISLITIFFFYCINILNAQSVAINTDGTAANSSAILDVKSTNKGVLIPRLTKTERNAIVSPANGLLVYQNDNDTSGFYFYKLNKWVLLNANDSTTVLSVNMNISGGAIASPTILPTQGAYLGLTSTGTDNYFQLPNAVNCPGRLIIIRNNNDINWIYVSATSPSRICPGSGTCFTNSSDTYELKSTASVKTIICISDGINWTVGQLN